MKEDVKMVQMLLKKHAVIEEDEDNDSNATPIFRLEFKKEPFSADVNSSEVVSFTADMDDDTLADYAADYAAIGGIQYERFTGISHTQRKHYWGKDSWAECHNVAVADIKKASPLSVALAIGNKEIIALLKNAGAISHSENATTPVTYDWNLNCK